MEDMDERSVRIAELSEPIGKLNQLIELHQQTTKDAAMIQEYIVWRNKFVQDLQTLFQPLHLTVSVSFAA
jgi:hypothetical protein